jgi:hypothetical protein
VGDRRPGGGGPEELTGGRVRRVGLPWHLRDFSGDGTIGVVGMPPGRHRVPIEVAKPEHRIRTDDDIHGSRDRGACALTSRAGPVGSPLPHARGTFNLSRSAISPGPVGSHPSFLRVSSLEAGMSTPANIASQPKKS